MISYFLFSGLTLIPHSVTITDDGDFIFTTDPPTAPPKDVYPPAISSKMPICRF
jgi:hypothetical protein